MIRINWRVAATNPPTEEDLEKGRSVTVFDGLFPCGIRAVALSQVLSDDKWCRCSEFQAHIESTLSPPGDSGGCETIQGLRDYSSDPPTKSDANNEGYVVMFWKDGSYGSWPCDKSWTEGKPVFWCTSDDFHRVRESIFRIATSRTESTLNPHDSQHDSQWVFAPLPGESDEEAAKHGRRWPTGVDGQHILWMADSWSQPGVHLFDAFTQASHCYRHNLRWMRIPPCPEPPKRELPAVAPESLPAFVTLRNGEHAIATRKCPGEHATTLLGCKAINGRFGSESSWWYVATGRAMANKLSGNDIVHVGGWITKEELEAKRNGN